MRFLTDNAPFLTAGALLTLLSSFGQTFFISIFEAQIRADFGLSHGQWGSIYTIGTAASAAAMVWAGALTDRFRSRSLGALVLALLAASCLFMALNPWAGLLPLAIFLLRFAGQGMVSHIAVVSMSRWFVASRGKALAVARLGFSLGEAFLPLAFVAAMTVLDWRWLWVGAAAFALAMIPVLLRLLRLERTPQSHAETDESLGMQDRHWRRGEVLRHELFWFMVPLLLGPSAFNTAFFFWQVHFAEVKGWTHLQLVALFPLFTGLSVLAMIGTGILQDRIGAGRLVALSLVPMVAAFAVFGLGQGLGWAAVGLGFMALNAGAFGTLVPAFWAEFYGTRHLGAIKAMAVAVMVLGTALGPGLTGLLIDAGVGIEAQYLGVAAYFACAAALTALGVARARSAWTAQIDV